MKYNGVYEVNPAFINGGSIKWHSTGNGEYIIATKGGRRFFVKRNMHVRYPEKGMPKEVYNRYKTAAEALQRKQEKLRSLMEGLDWATDNIVVEEENFWDGENSFATVTALVPDALPDTYDYSALSIDEFIRLARTAAEALHKLHTHGVIHGDIKGKNIIVTHKDGVYTPYIIDFDSSYPADAVPERDAESEEAGGSPGYQSPELLAYGKGLWEKDAVTPATDIFSLAVVLHKWWANAFPGVDPECGSVGAAVYLGEEVMIDRKFDVRIGKDCGATLVSLINWMLAKDPAQRPTAKQVADVLADKMEVPEAYHKGGDVKPFDSELWSAHNLVAELLPVAKLKERGVKSLKRTNEGSGSMSLKYRVATGDGSEKVLTVAELCSAGYAKSKGAEVEEPWEEHMIELATSDEIVAKGYAKIKRAQLAFRKRYLITTVSGREIDKGYEWLIAEGLAHPRLVEVDADTPWPEHGKEYNLESMSRLGVKSISRMEVGGEHRYKIVYNEIVDGINKTNERVPVNNLKLMGFIK